MIKMRLTLIAVFVLGLFIHNATGQDFSDFQKSFQYKIQPSSKKIKIDGILDEAAWTSSAVAKDFKKKYPNDIGDPKNKPKYVSLMIMKIYTLPLKYMIVELLLLKG